MIELIKALDTSYSVYIYFLESLPLTSNIRRNEVRALDYPSGGDPLVEHDDSRCYDSCGSDLKEGII
jgi:hypothetical protein